MRKFATQAIIISLLVSHGLAQDIYIVKHGDVLTRIVKNKYATKRIYGPKGKLAEVIRLNPNIIDPNKIFPGQKIQFTPQVVIKSAQEEKLGINTFTEEIQIEKTVRDVKEKKREVSEPRTFEEWNVYILNGAKYFSLSQSGALGKADIGVLFLNNLKLNSEFNFTDWSFGFQFDTYKFKYKTLTAGDSDQMYAINLYGSYGWILGGLNIEQNPLFRNNNGNIEMTKMNLISLSVGAKKDIHLPTRRPTVFKLKGWLNYPLSVSSANAEIELNSIKGYGLYGEVELGRQIIANDDYSLHASWMSQIGIQRLNQKVEWDTSVGEAQSNIVNASTSLGISFKF